MSTKILMVCLGNICRSPLAEGLLQDKLPSDKFIVDSAGTGSWHIGNPPDSRSIAVAKKNGIYIHNQKCRQLHINDFERFDHIYVMDRANLREVLALAKEAHHKKKVKLLLEVLDHKNTLEVPDPYYGGNDGFDLVFKLIDQATLRIANKLLQTI